jgi:hypothetical protein
MNLNQALKSEWLPKRPVRYLRRRRAGQGRRLEEFWEDCQ